MAKLVSSIDTSSEDFRTNAQAMAELVRDLTDKRAEIARGGPAKARERHHARGKLLARERVNQLLDPGSPFLEIAAMAAFGMYEDEIHAAGLIAGIDLRSSREFTRSVVEGLKGRRVLAGATGRGGHVLKVRPPLAWTEVHADRFVSALREVLDTL